MSIEQFSRAAQGPSPAQDAVFGQTDQGGIELQEPLKAPGKWTMFKAALSHVPLLGRIGALQEARSAVADYPVKLEQYQVTNRQILAGFVQDLQARYGDHIADMAMRDATPTDGAPLSQRAVTTILEQAGRAEMSQKARNNMEITRFMESPLQGGMRLPGETDMNGVFLDKDFSLAGAGGWREAVGDGAADFVTAYVMKSAAALPDHGKGPIANETIARLAGEALDIYSELKASPDMTTDRLDTILSAASTRGSAAQIVDTAREKTIVARLETQLDRRDPESMLRQAAARIADEMGMPPLTDAVLKTISNNIVDKLTYVTKGLPEVLDCDPEMTALMEAIDEKLTTNVERAITEHLEAQQLIAGSETMTEDQQAFMTELAGRRRIDPVQVEQYGLIGGSVRSAMDGVSDFAGGGSVEDLLESLRGGLRSFEEGLPLMKEHGDGMWEAGSLDGGDMTNQLMEEFAKFAAAGMTREEAQELLGHLTGDRVSMLLSAMRESGDMTIAAQLPILLSTMVSAVAERAGQTPEQAVQTARDQFDRDPIDLADVPPSIVMAVLTAAPEEFDDRSVFAGARHGDLVSPDYSPETVLETNRELIVSYVEDAGVDEAEVLPAVTLRDMGRATFQVDGVRIGTAGSDKQEVKDAFMSAFEDEPEGMAEAVGRCMNQQGINAFVELNNRGAFGEGSFIAAQPGGGTEHEAWRQEDGSWIVRSTFSQRPVVLSRPEGDTHIETDGLDVFSITYRVTPPVGEGKPVITIEDSQVMFGL